mmetsp:Transcript_28154/g.51280  ORF Transcript_28154/g.51280 Transcript_28154/m.51280 type:complete len:712 (-) Transcript_28154:4-2139(-)
MAALDRYRVNQKKHRHIVIARMLQSTVALAVLTSWATGFVPVPQKNVVTKTRTEGMTSFVRLGRLIAKTSHGHLAARGEDDEDEDDIDLSDQDWRAFRAKLVMTEPTTSENSASSTEPSSTTTLQDEDDLDGIGSVFASPTSGVSVEEDVIEGGTGMEGSTSFLTPLDPSQWAYDSGNVIEQGAVILGGVEQEFGFGLRQQYFHKAAILVLDHDDSTFTKGIILNRPSDRMLADDVNEVLWRVWCGGDVQGINSPNPEIVCLHSLNLPLMGEDAAPASVQVMKDIQWTTFDNAKDLVKMGVAKPTDFWVFCGYAGWGPGQLMGELDRKSWYMVATDSQTLLKELARQSSSADPRDAGLDTWELLMNMIGRGETVEECSGDFDDLMLKEWAREHLLSIEAGGGAMRSQQDAALEEVDSMKQTSLPIDRLLKRVSAAVKANDVTVGSLVRASSADRSPFLLQKQEFHKSLVLIISDDENLTVGCILNRPASKGLTLEQIDKKTLEKKTLTMPLRFGGEYAVKGKENLLWLHCNPDLREANVGSEVGVASKDNIWKCTQDEALGAVSNGLATPSDFLVVSGVCVWTKGEGGTARGIQGEVQKGSFEVIASDSVPSVWDCLLKQEVVTPLNLLKTIRTGNQAWEVGGTSNNQGDPSQDSSKAAQDMTVLDGIGEGYDEEDDSLVFKSDKKISSLCDDALQTWVATFLLGSPGLGA